MTHDEKHRQLVLAVNELFHDLEGEDYDAAHPEIFSREGDRWKRLLGKYLPKDESRTIIDIGSGTGFVSREIAAFLSSGETVICADISEKMLSIATERVKKDFPMVSVQSLKMTDEAIRLADHSVNAVAMNSVLHHIPNTERFLSEIHRILKPGGQLFIGHEPNTRFANNVFLYREVAILNALRPKRIFSALLGMIRGKTSVAVPDAFLERLNAKLSERGLIERPLSRTEISQLLDVHSPTAGGLRRKEEGFDPWTVLGPRFHTLEIETYSHLGKLSGRHLVLRPYEAILRRLAPKSGSLFFIVAEKAV